MSKKCVNFDICHRFGLLKNGVLCTDDCLDRIEENNKLKNS